VNNHLNCFNNLEVRCMPKCVVRLLKPFSALLSFSDFSDEVSSNMILQMWMRHFPWLFPTCKYSIHSSIFSCQHHWPVLLFLQGMENRSRFSSYHYSWTTQGTQSWTWFLYIYTIASFGVKICLDICLRTFSFLRSEQFSEKVGQQIMSKGKYPSIFLRQVEGTVFIIFEIFMQHLRFW